jgi:hypothetical protein
LEAYGPRAHRSRKAATKSLWNDSLALRMAQLPRSRAREIVRLAVGMVLVLERALVHMGNIIAYARVRAVSWHITCSV